MYYKNKNCEGKPMVDHGTSVFNQVEANKCTKTQSSQFLKVTTTLTAKKQTPEEKKATEKKYSYILISIFIAQILCCICGFMAVGGKVHKAERELVRDQAQYYSTLLKVHQTCVQQNKLMEQTKSGLSDGSTPM